MFERQVISIFPKWDGITNKFLCLSTDLRSLRSGNHIL